APELFDSPPRYSPSSDLYALGMTLACLLLPSDPFPDGPIAPLLDWIQHGPRPRFSARRPDLPAPLAGLVDRMMAARAEDRPASAAEALASLGNIPAMASPPRPGPGVQEAPP